MPRNDNYLGATADRLALRFAVQKGQRELTALLGKRQQKAVNSLIRLAGYQAGLLFVEVFLPKRFDPSYARGALGYRASSRYERMKVSLAAGRRFATVPERESMPNLRTVIPPQPRPFVASGTSMRACLSSATVQVRMVGSQSRLRILVRCSTGAIRFTPQYRNFTTITNIERQRVQQEFERQLADLTRSTGPDKEFTSNFRFSHERRLASGAERRLVGSA